MMEPARNYNLSAPSKNTDMWRIFDHYQSCRQPPQLRQSSLVSCLHYFSMSRNCLRIRNVSPVSLWWNFFHRCMWPAKTCPVQAVDFSTTWNGRWREHMRQRRGGWQLTGLLTIKCSSFRSNAYESNCVFMFWTQCREIFPTQFVPIELYWNTFRDAVNGSYLNLPVCPILPVANRSPSPNSSS